MGGYIGENRLAELLTKIKNAFVRTKDTVEADTISIDSIPTANSTNLVTSGGVKAAIDNAVEANPTIPSGTTPTSLTGLKIGSGYYDIDAGGGTVTDVTVGGTSVVNASGVAEIPAIPELVALSSNEIDAIIEEAEQ